MSEIKCLLLNASKTYECNVCKNVAYGIFIFFVLISIIGFLIFSFYQAKRELNDPENAIIGAFAGT